MKILRLFALIVCLSGSVQAQSYTTLGPPGQYSFQFSTNAQTKITSGPGWLRIEWAGDTAPAPPVVVPPPPDPVNPIPSNPNPKPAPKPIAIPATPVKGPMFLVASWDGQTLSPAQQDLINDKTLGKSLPNYTYWKAFPLTALDGWKTDAAAAGNPSLIVIGNGGHYVTGGSLPSSKQEILDLAKKLRGG